MSRWGASNVADVWRSQCSDAERNCLITYQEQSIREKNPLQALDRSGVGKLMDWAISEGRKTRPSLEVGICGEHGGEPSSIEWCHIIGNN